VTTAQYAAATPNNAAKTITRRLTSDISPEEHTTTLFDYNPIYSQQEAVNTPTESFQTRFYFDVENYEISDGKQQRGEQHSCYLQHRSSKL
jgi:hypothetical protein